LREAVGQEFQGNEAAEFGVLGFVDHTHAASADFFDDNVVRYGLADHCFSRCVLIDPILVDPSEEPGLSEA
jgi:hypothetical protein